MAEDKKYNSLYGNVNTVTIGLINNGVIIDDYRQSNNNSSKDTKVEKITEPFWANDYTNVWDSDDEIKTPSKNDETDAIKSLFGSVGKVTVHDTVWKK